jgi:hypothetical protein
VAPAARINSSVAFWSSLSRPLALLSSSRSGTPATVPIDLRIAAWTRLRSRGAWKAKRLPTSTILRQLVG